GSGSGATSFRSILGAISRGLLAASGASTGGSCGLPCSLVASAWARACAEPRRGSECSTSSTFSSSARSATNSAVASALVSLASASAAGVVKNRSDDVSALVIEYLSLARSISPQLPDDVAPRIGACLDHEYGCDRGLMPLS